MEDLIIAALYLFGILCCMALDWAERTYIAEHRRRPQDRQLCVLRHPQLRRDPLPLQLLLEPMSAPKPMFVPATPSLQPIFKVKAWFWRRAKVQQLIDDGYDHGDIAQWGHAEHSAFKLRTAWWIRYNDASVKARELVKFEDLAQVTLTPVLAALRWPRR